MKFKTLFISFNIVLILSCIIIFFMPALILDSAFMASFWSSNWYFALIFALVLFSMDAVFLYNWKTLTLLEREDWPALAAWMEKRVFEAGRLSARNVRLLCDALLILGDFDTAKRLETVLLARKPALFAKSALRFAAIRLIAKQRDGLSEFALSSAELKGAEKDWLKFYAGFTAQLEQKWEKAADSYLLLAREAGEPVVTALSGYLLGAAVARNLGSRKEELRSAAEAARTRVRERYNGRSWQRVLEDARSSTAVIVFAKLLDELPAWLEG